mmetsp:Transcript_9337/g.10835  ORF Transcript_9337/g.10835 Transcript_9337/m.10835 type:complete len:284 (-) Transcript_9337:472-1323(-)|eukprot:CAMPEP_0204832396 /NCGR_PEP_ID=MMETSP1346-20131115/13521_1 /ASSEMBLY_ACC=CAM_ASM_000771 /TAXON_ID=215587 /ORGANISM="Aplanochytrium stocchinoi, Strain GSBS06" /LENGTH=283 /DNA_ID=CAMNT_0051964181 /DNA_START=147 /DNA_END=998 /DNA_ORIENTATION=+
MNEHAFHSRSEFKESRAKSGYGTLRQRLGEDSQLSFGHCSLSLKPVEDPVCSPSGHLYSKEVIYEYLLSKIASLDKENKAYEEQQANLNSQRSAQSQKRKHEEIEKFIHTQESVSDANTETGGKNSSNSVLDRLSKKIDTRTRKEKELELKGSSPWLPQFAPEADEKLLKQPRRRPPSPITGADLRLKDLYPVDLERSEDGKSFLCAVTKKEIKYQTMVLIRKSKKVMTKESFDRLAKMSKRCPITNIKFKDKDVINLQSGSSSFAASAKEKAQAKKHRPNFQ